MEAHWIAKVTNNHATFSKVLEADLIVDGRSVSDLSNNELEEAKAFFFDRWNWETNGEQDRAIYEQLDKEWKARREGGRFRKLSTSWTMEAMDILQSEYGMDLEEEIATAVAKELDNDDVKDLIKEMMALSREEE